MNFAYLLTGLRLSAIPFFIVFKLNFLLIFDIFLLQLFVKKSKIKITISFIEKNKYPK